MQKKLLAVAVAGALVAPAAAIAQTSVTIYGTISTSIESRSATGADSGAAVGAGGSSLRNQGGMVVAGSGVGTIGGGYAAAPADLSSRSTTQSAGSNFGLRVREDLGGGMYAWAQAELSIAMLGVTPVSPSSGGTGPTYRNTALALGSKAWGDVVFGVWDTPLNANMGSAPVHAAYGNASTSFLAQAFGGNPMGPATNSGQTLTAMCQSGLVATGAAAGNFMVTGSTTSMTSAANTCLSHALSFHRRASNSLQYWSPNWGGFQFKAVYTAEDLKGAQNLAGGNRTLTPNLWGGSLSYGAGPLYVGVGYERHNDYTAHAVRTWSSVSTNTVLGPGAAAATGSGFYLGGAGASLAYIPGVMPAGGAASGIGSSKDTAWNFNARYTFGAFTLGAYLERLKWTMSYDGTLTGGEVTELRKKAWGLEGAFRTGPHTLGIRYARANNLEGSTATGALGGGSFNGDGSGMNSWIFGYGYNFSKRTSLFGYHTRVTNDTNSRVAGIVFNGLTPASGGDPKYTGIGIRHAF